nr:SDR family oxidoreductase [Listeria sp. PSOL-1]
MGRFNCLIIGASGDIGTAISLKLAKRGYNLYLQYNKGEKAISSLLKELALFPGEYIPIQADLNEHQSVTTISESIFQLDMMIYAAGNTVYKLLTDTTDDEMSQLWNVHLYAMMRLVRDLSPKITKSEQGRIILISSIWGEMGAVMESVYSAVKGGQITFSKALSKELAYSGTTVNCITPGAVDTKMMDFFNRDEKEATESEIPFGRMATTDEVANAVLFLVSENASYITGQTLGINGGWHM